MIDRIATALVALVRAIPGVHDVDVFLRPDGTAHVTVNMTTDDAARTVAAQAGIALALADVAILDRNWLEGRGEIGSTEVTVAGPHHQWRAVEADTSAVDVALEQANAAIGGAL